MPRRDVARTVLLFLCLGLAAASASGDAVPPLPEGAFSIVALPDTQAYSANSPGTFRAEVQWILDNIVDQRIVFVSHVGDIVDDNSSPDEWEVAKRSMRMLHGLVPYGLSVGNHDMVCSNGDSSNYQAIFPQSLFKGFSWYGGAYKNNADSWQVFSAGGMDFIIVHLECNAPDDVLAWAGTVLTAHPEHRAIITTHMYLGPLEKPRKPEDFFDAPKGRMRWKKCHGQAANTPEQLWDKCFRKHKHVFMILCGDQSRTQAFYQCSTGESGNEVHELLSDYRDGYLRLYRFLPSQDRVEVFTYSPTLEKLCESTKIVPERNRHQFSFPYDMAVVNAAADPLHERAAEHILSQVGPYKGYCLDYGAGEGMLARQLAAHSALKIIGVEEDPTKVRNGRLSLHADDAYGVQITLHQGSLDHLPYRDFAAALVVSNAILETGKCPGSAAEMFRMVRPDGGMALIGQPPGCPNPLSEDELRAWLDEAELEYTITNAPSEGIWARVERGPLSGAGEWTHMWADLGNTACSGDTRTTDHSKVLWFGEPGPRLMVDRHWEPVSPLYKHGRLFVPGLDRIVCVDAYNGARLWDLEAPNSSRIAMMRDAGYLVLDDRFLYVAVEGECLEVDVDTGQIGGALHVSAEGRDWGYLAVDAKRLFGSEQLPKASYLAASTGRGAEGNQLGRGDNRFLITSTALFCRDKVSGAELWHYGNPEAVIANPTVCIGDGGVFFFESAEPSCVSDDDGRVLMADFTKDAGEFLVKLDRESGQILWRHQHDVVCRHVFHLSYAKGILLASGCTTVSGNYWYHLRAYSAENGSLLWERDLDSTFGADDANHGKQDKHAMIIGDTVQLKQGSFELATGNPLGLAFNTSNCADCAASMNHVFTRNNGVATIISLNEGGDGAPLCSVLRPGCYISIIPAGGVIMLPAFSAGCTCGHSIQTSIAWLPQ